MVVVSHCHCVQRSPGCEQYTSRIISTSTPPTPPIHPFSSSTTHHHHHLFTHPRSLPLTSTSRRIETTRLRSPSTSLPSPSIPEISPRPPPAPIPRPALPLSTVECLCEQPNNHAPASSRPSNLRESPPRAAIQSRAAPQQSCLPSPVLLAKPSGEASTMPATLDTPVLTVDVGLIHKVDTRNVENLFSMWTGELVLLAAVKAAAWL